MDTDISGYAPWKALEPKDGGHGLAGATILQTVSLKTSCTVSALASTSDTIKRVASLGFGGGGIRLLASTIQAQLSGKWSECPTCRCYPVPLILTVLELQGTVRVEDQEIAHIELMYPIPDGNYTLEYFYSKPFHGQVRAVTSLESIDH